FFGSFIDVMGTIRHGAIVDVASLGAPELARDGNSNTPKIVNPEPSVRRFNGSGGANDMASNAKRTIIIARHEARKLVERVSHLTSPGFLEGGRSREEAGLRGGGPWRVLTDKAVLGFDESTRRMKLVSVHPGVSHQELRDSTGFPIEIPSDAPVTPEPSADEVRLIRELDPNHLYT